MGREAGTRRGSAARRYKDYARHLITRVNTVNGRRYADDDTIMGAHGARARAPPPPRPAPAACFA